MDYEAKLEEIAQKIRAIDYESGGNYTLGIIAILRESFPDEGRKNHPVLNPEVLVADIRAEGSPGKGRWKMSHKMAGDAVIAFTKNWAANVLASEAPTDGAKGEADELLAQLAKIFEDEAEYRDMILWTPMNPRKEVRGLTRSDIENIFATSRVFSPMRDFLQSLAARQPESADGDLASALAIAANMQARAEQAESDLASERKYSAACARHRDEAEAASREAESGARALREALHLQAANISFLKKAIQAGDPKSKLILRCDDIASAALDGSAKEEER